MILQHGATPDHSARLRAQCINSARPCKRVDRGTLTRYEFPTTRRAL